MSRLLLSRNIEDGNARTGPEEGAAARSSHHRPAGGDDDDEEEEEEAAAAAAEAEAVPEEAGTSDAKKDRPLAEHKLVVAEDREIGVVSRATYAQYVRSGGSCSFACVGLLMVAGRSSRCGC